MGWNRAKSKGRANGPTFVALPHELLTHDNFKRLSARALKLFIDMYSEYNGHNNGDFSATISVMRKRNWKSKQTLALALDELLHYGIVMQTRQGQKDTKLCYLYGVTFKPIDECDGKLDVKPDVVAPRTWQARQSDWQEPEWYTKYKAKKKARRKLKSDTRIPTQTRTESDPVSAGTRTESDPDMPGVRPNNAPFEHSTRSESDHLSRSIPGSTHQSSGAKQ